MTRGGVLFFDVFNQEYLPLVEAVVGKGFLPIMNATPLARAARHAGLPVQQWESSVPAEIVPRVQGEVDKIGRRLAGSVEEPAVGAQLARTIGLMGEGARAGFFGQVFSLLANQIAALEIFAAVDRQSDLRLLVLGCDNSHIQRVIVESARLRGLPSLQLAHGIYAPVRARLAGEMNTIYADYVAAFGERARDILVGSGNSAERVLLTGAPTWDPLYGRAARMDARSARRQVGLDPERATVLLCAGYADGSSGFFPGVIRELCEMYRAVLRATNHARSPVQLIVRPHPHEFNRAGVSAQLRKELVDHHRGILRRLGHDHVRVVVDDKLACVRAADVVIVEGYSTMAPEAMILDRPVIALRFAHQDPPVFGAADGIQVAESLEELTCLLDGLLEDRHRRRAVVSAQAAALPALNYLNDGRACERVAAAIDRLALRTRPGATRARESRRGASGLDLLFTAHDFMPYTRAGTELYTYDLARALERRGHGVRVLYPRFVVGGEGASQIETGDYQGLRVIEAFTGAAAVQMLRNEALLPSLRRYLCGRRPDIVHVQHLMGLSVSLLELLDDLDIPIVVTANDYWWLCQQVHLMRGDGTACAGPESIERCVACTGQRIDGADAGGIVALREYITRRLDLHRQALARADLVLCPSRHLLDTFRCHGFEGRRMVYAPQGANVFTPLAREHDGTERVRFAYLGSICRRKGIDLLIAAFNQIDPKRAELHVHGKILESDYFEEVLRGVLPGHVIVYEGEYGPADLAQILARTDVGIVASRGENFPFVIREMLHAGVPVIAPALGGIPEIIDDDVNGRLFRANDVADLGERLRSVVADKGCVERWRRMMRPVRSIDADAREIEGHYGDVLARRALARKVGVVEARRDPASPAAGPIV